jgi:opacity protein-like surface antigen
LRSYLLSGACAASMLLALTPVAQAADIEVAPPPMGWSWYISVFGGWSLPRDERFSFEDGATFEADIDPDNGFLVGAALGAHINNWLRGEVEVSGHWHDLEGSASTDFGGAFNNYLDIDGDENAQFILGNLWVDLPIDEVIRPYVGGGIGFGRLDMDMNATWTVSGAEYSVIDDSDWGFAYQVGAGVAFDITPNIAIDVGYRYKVINNLNFNLDDEIIASLGYGDGEELEKDYKSHNVLVGLRFSF